MLSISEHGFWNVKIYHRPNRALLNHSCHPSPHFLLQLDTDVLRDLLTRDWQLKFAAPV